MDNWGWNLTLLVGIIILELFSLVIFYRFHGIHHKECGSRLNDDAHFPPNIQDGALCLKPIPYQWGQNYHYISEKNMWCLVGPQWKSHVNFAPHPTDPSWVHQGFLPKEWRWRPRAFGTSDELHLDKLSLAAERVLGVKTNRGKKAVSVWLANVFVWGVFFSNLLSHGILRIFFSGGWFFVRNFFSIGGDSKDSDIKLLTRSVETSLSENLFSTPLAVSIFAIIIRSSWFDSVWESAITLPGNVCPYPKRTIIFEKIPMMQDMCYFPGG